MSRYGTLAYKLEELQKKLDETKTAANLLNEERGEIMEIPKSFNGWLRPDEFKFGGRLEHFHGGGIYNSFDPENKNHVNSSLEKAEKLAPQVLEKAKARHEENMVAIETNRKARENIFKFLASYGVRTEKYKDIGTGRNKKSVKVTCDWVGEINDQISINDGYDSFVSGIDSNLKQVKEEAKKYLIEIAKTEREQERKIQESKGLVEAITYLKEQNISVDGLTPEHIRDLAENDRREKWISAHFPNGTEMDHSCCDNCSDWTVGERRCSCGNRRMNLVVEGKHPDYYAYAEAY